VTTFTSRTCPSQFMGRPGCRVAEPRSLMAAAGDRLSGGLCAELPGAAVALGEPSLICLRSSNSVNRRDSVPTKLRSASVPSQAIAFSVAGIRSKCGSSEACA
jgi:hypothetical protein